MPAHGPASPIGSSTRITRPIVGRVPAKIQPETSDTPSPAQHRGAQPTPPNSYFSSYSTPPTTTDHSTRNSWQAPGLIWLSRHSERRSNVVRVVLTAGWFTAMLIGGMGFGHYLILLFAAGGLAATMPVKPGARLFPLRLSPTVVAGPLAMMAAVVLVFGYVIDRWRPLSHQAAAAAFSPDAVNRNPVLARACPPGSLALVWGWATELHGPL